MITVWGGRVRRRESNRPRGGNGGGRRETYRASAIKRSDRYDALDKIKSKNNEDPLKIFNTAISNVKPNLECRSRRVGGATYQVPVEVKAKRAQALALRWIMDATRKRKNKTMADKLYAEIVDASQNKGSAIKKREDTHKMAESNKAFAHFRW